MGFVRSFVIGLLLATSPLALFAQAHAQVPSPSRASAPAVSSAASPATSAPSTKAEFTVEGRVRRPLERGGDSTGMGAATGAWVTLHRVGKDTAGPIDSMKLDAAGRYRFRWRPSGAKDAVYFASVTWGGIAYFTAPLRDTDTRGDAAEITVFDTTTRAMRFAVKGRHLIVGKADSTDTRTVVEVFELSNDSLRTMISPDVKPPVPTWSVVVPQAALDVRVMQGEIAPEAFAHAPGRVSIFAPIAPGIKQVAFSYKMAAANFPITVRAEQGAVVFEILMEEPEGRVFGSAFTAVDPVTIDGRKFQRFLAQDLRDGSEVTVELPTTRAPGRTLYAAGVLVAIGFIVLLLILRAMQRRTTAKANAQANASVSPLAGPLRAAAVRPSEAPTAERIAREIAALDAAYARIASPSESVREAYQIRRRELDEAHTEALASAPAEG